MTNRRSTCSKVLALVLPATLGLACGLKRDWSICAPGDKQPCLPGYLCTPDLRCVLAGDGGSDALVAVDSQGPADAAGGALDGPAPVGTDGPGGAGTDGPGGVAIGPDGPEPDRAPAAVPPDAPVGTAPDAPPATNLPDAPPASLPDAPPATLPDGPPVGGPPDAPVPDASTADASGTCSADKDCPAQLCLANRCAKCAGDNDCTGRTGTPICAASGLCVACSAGSKRCSSLQPQLCSAAGQWQDSGSPCPTICNGGTCAACAPGAQQCNGLQPQTCNASGAWQDTGSACPYLCNNTTGACAGNCKPTSVQCSGLQPQTCNASGAWQNNGSACPYVCNNATGACSGACTPTTKQCSGSQPQTCDANGAWQNTGNACFGCATCSAATGACAPATGTPCDDGNACTTGETCQAGVCTGGTTMTCPAPATCRGAGTCNPGTGTCTYPLAANNSSCDDGNACTQFDSCQAGVCTGTQILCNSPPACKLVTTCSSGNCSYTQSVTDGTQDAKCASATPYCYAGNCVGCTSDAQCPSTKPSCDLAAHTCGCRKPSAGNRLTNPGFDGSMSGWTNLGTVSLSTDSDGCSASNSIYCDLGGDERDPRQCITLAAGTYYFGGKFKGGGNDYGNEVTIDFYDGPGCTGNYLNEWQYFLSGSADWVQSWGAFTTPSGTASALVGVIAEYQYLDQLYVNTANQF